MTESKKNFMPLVLVRNGIILHMLILRISDLQLLK